MSAQISTYSMRCTVSRVTLRGRPPPEDSCMTCSQEVGGLKSPGRGRSQRYVIDRLSEKSSVVTEPWERLLEVVGVVSLLCDWQRERKQAGHTRSSCSMFQSCVGSCLLRTLNCLPRCCVQIVTCCTLVLFHSAFHYVSAVQPSLFQGQFTHVCVCLYLLNYIVN
uniref:Integrator complex subunit 10 n=1 Tax=Cyprinus carpio carpio TaxID=630221 RepID=A0A9J8AIQ5_CYPCA